MIWSAEGGEGLSLNTAHTNAITCLSAPQSKSHFVSGGLDGVINVWRLKYKQSGTFESTYLDKTIKNSSIVCALHCSGDQIISGGKDGKVRVFGLHTGEMERQISVCNGPIVEMLMFSPTYLVSMSSKVQLIPPFVGQKPHPQQPTKRRDPISGHPGRSERGVRLRRLPEDEPLQGLPPAPQLGRRLSEGLQTHLNVLYKLNAALLGFRIQAQRALRGREHRSHHKGGPEPLPQQDLRRLRAVLHLPNQRRGHRRRVPSPLRGKYLPVPV
jgi:WD domain, G-beta repeat